LRIRKATSQWRNHEKMQGWMRD